MDEEVVGRIAPRERAHQDEKSGPQLSSQRTRKSACGGGIVQGLSLHYPRKLRAGVRGGGGQGGLREAIPRAATTGRPTGKSMALGMALVQILPTWQLQSHRRAAKVGMIGLTGAPARAQRDVSTHPIAVANGALCGQRQRRESGRGARKEARRPWLREAARQEKRDQKARGSALGLSGVWKRLRNST